MKIKDAQAPPKLWVYNYNFEFELLKRARKTVNASRFSPWFFLNRSALLLAPLTASRDLTVAYKSPPEIVLRELSDKLGCRPRFALVNPVESESNSILHDMETDRDLISRIYGFQLAPWGWCPRAKSFSDKYLKTSGPPAEQNVTRRLNSKQFSCFLREKYLDSGFSIPALDITPERLSQAPLEKWLDGFSRKHPEFYVKHYLGAAGKLSDLCGEPPSLNRMRKWRAWIREAGGVLLEQKVDIKRERSVQVEVALNETIIPITFTELLSSSSNSYLGNIVSDANRTIPEKLWKQLSPVRRIIAESGYIGPLGIDLLEAKDGSLKLLEINARFTMGRIAFEWHKAVNPFPVGLFFNLFIKNSPFSRYEDIYSELKKPEREYDCSILPINLAADGNRNFSATVLIGAEFESEIWKILERVRAILNLRSAT